MKSLLAMLGFVALTTGCDAVSYAEVKALVEKGVATAEAAQQLVSGNSGSAGAGAGSCQEMFYRATAPRLPEELQAGTRRLCFDDFAVLHSSSSRSPLYAAEVLTPASLKDADEKRTDHFYEEARLPSAERGRLSDYRGSGYDRGHLAAAAQRTTPEAMAQSFSLANMVPQSPENNRGVWAKAVERAVRHYVSRSGNSVYVITGIYYDPQQAPRYAGRVRVPDALYKVVREPQSGKTWAYWTPNADVARPEMLTYHQIVDVTGIDFFPEG